MKNIIRRAGLLIMICLPGLTPAAGQSGRTDALMPVPKTYSRTAAHFTITRDFRVAVTGPCDQRLYAEASRFIRRLSERTGIFLDRQGFVSRKDNNPSSPLLIKVQRPGKLLPDEDESYHLEVTSSQVILTAPTDIGAIRGLETLLQLLSAESTDYFFPGVIIDDAPRFHWRGLLLDVALHFMPVQEIKTTLDGMAAVKMNVLHLHLCNDQGFRVESKTFPRLHRMASDGLYYTYEDIRSIIEYAGQRGIRVVPEFVVPAHTTAILTAYPELASVKRNYSLQRYFGVFDPVMDPTNEKVYTFLDKLFTEMARLFPDPYFHIGGDENTGRDWQQTPHIRDFMTAHGMKSYMDLQTYFNRRIQPILRRNGKIMMGWDEIWQPGVPKDIVIQSWRGTTSFYASVRAGYKSILSNGYYIDLIQPASFHYRNDPIPDSVHLTPVEESNILGGEATMWSELVSTETVDSRIWPRTAAIAERLWSPRSVSDTNDMYRRLDLISLQLEYLGLRHELHQQSLLRRLAGSRDTRALRTLVDVLEPLKIYERNQGDTMYTVFSPLTKLADAAIPDQPTPRQFNRLVDDYLKTLVSPTEKVIPEKATPEKAILEKAIREKLTLWKDNDTAFQRLLLHAPVLQEAAPLSQNLSALSSAGLQALQLIHTHTGPSPEWVRYTNTLAVRAKEQSGRCELQVTDAIYKLILRAGQSGDSPPTTGFWQEYHEPYPVSTNAADNEVRSITVDRHSTVWIATAAGVFLKKQDAGKWTPCLAPGKANGPAYAVLASSVATRPDANPSGTVWIGAWNGLFRATNNTMEQVPGTDGPISALCAAPEGIYALGPRGAWLFDGQQLIKKDYTLPRSIRSATPDPAGNGIWIGSDVGLFHCTGTATTPYQGPASLISAGLKGLAFDDNHLLWAGGLGGVSILDDGKKQKEITPREGCPSIYVSCVRRSPDGSMWVGTRVGVVRYYPDGTHSLRFSRRWLLDDQVNDVAFDSAGDAWIATAKGVSAIRRRHMTLASKEDYFYNVLMKRHIRAPWIAGQCHLNIPGDTTSWVPEDDDNDGEFTGNYLAMESFRYAVTHSEDARIKAGKAFRFLKQLQEVTGGDGFFARTIVPAQWGDHVHDGNTRYTDQQRAEKEVEDPRYKPVEDRWKLSADGKWRWKRDASSDEWCGHMLGYFFYYQLVADDKEKEIVRRHVATLVNHLIAHNFYMVDIDGTHTHWAVWSPGSLNRDPEWAQDRAQNSMELLSFLKLAGYMTGDTIYEHHYRRLINEEHYLDNMANITRQDPAWFIYFDVTMQAYFLPILLHCEKDPALLDFYRRYADEWMEKRKYDHNPLLNFLYSYARGIKTDSAASLDFLTDTPLDLIDWHIDHTQREDVHLVHNPVLDEWQVDELPPASIRQVVRWDKNPWGASGGEPNMEREPVFWLLPYWMGRFLQLITPQQ